MVAARMLRQARGEASLEDFAARLGVDAAELELWESGHEFPADRLVLALHLSGVKAYLLDGRQLRAVGDFTRETKRLLNSPEHLWTRYMQLVQRQARLIGWAAAGLLACLGTVGVLQLPEPAGNVQAPTMQPTASTAAAPADAVERTPVRRDPATPRPRVVATDWAADNLQDQATPAPTAQAPDPGAQPSPTPDSGGVREEARAAPPGAHNQHPIATLIPSPRPSVDLDGSLGT